jgi:hypothetical protein
VMTRRVALGSERGSRRVYFCADQESSVDLPEGAADAWASPSCSVGAATVRLSVKVVPHRNSSPNRQNFVDTLFLPEYSSYMLGGSRPRPTVASYILQRSGCGPHEHSIGGGPSGLGCCPNRRRTSARVHNTFLSCRRPCEKARIPAPVGWSQTTQRRTCDGSHVTVGGQRLSTSRARCESRR